MSKYMLISFLLLAACQTDDSDIDGAIVVVNGIPSIRIPTDSLDKAIKISDFISEIEVVPLEFSSESMLASVDNVFLSEDRIYIHDMMVDRILMFKRTGEFQAEIGKKGRGPGEYSTISDYYVDFDQERLILYDRSLFKFITFNFDGVFIDEVQKNIAAESIITDFDGHIVLFKNNWFGIDSREDANNISILDHDYAIVNEFYPLNPRLVNWRHRSWDHFHKNHHSKQLLFNSYFDFNIYSIERNQFNVAYRIDAGSRATNFDELFFDSPMPKVINDRLEEIQTIRGIESFYESEHFIHFHFWDTNVRNVILDKRMNKIKAYTGFENDIAANHTIYRKVFLMNGDEVLLAGPSLSDQNLNRYYGECCLNGKRDLSESTERGNPVLIIGKLNPSKELFN